ncbi:hypothetical protein DN752_19640 [Echinicola strongylocentroti]|uniref:Uncharacterized protein n=1 Tax=Echinicola strongylocentroti TaxID=1795355 RepID=A0A2Z4IMP6_9BACT|nr:hypothetical protein [Echinicola strongylocentroti]AWW32175.1 hypothetical protein DN752_19640 [Echinicola strongylocentroti]
MGVSYSEFWQMCPEEFKAIEKIWERKYREQMELWRLQTYYQAAHFFDPKKPTPTPQNWHPLPWDKQKKSETPFYTIEERIRIFKERGREDWIPKHWWNELGSAGSGTMDQGNEGIAGKAEA